MSKPIGTVVGSHEFDGDWIPAYYALPYVVGRLPRSRCEHATCTRPATHRVRVEDWFVETCSSHVAPVRWNLRWHGPDVSQLPLSPGS